MTGKPAAPTDLRMSEAGFDAMMHGARFEGPPKKAAPKKPAKAKAAKKKRTV